MNVTSDVNEWKQALWPTVEMKADEFELLGYGRIERDEVWKCITENAERGKIEKPFRLHQLVNEVLSLSLNDYMNRLRMEALRGPDWFSEGMPLRLGEFDDS